MANVESKWIEAISTLNELTQNKEIMWEVDHFPRIGRRAFRAQYGDKWFRLVVSDEAMSPTSSAFASVLGPPYILEIVDEIGTSLFQIPETSGLKDLYQSVQFQLSGVDEILDSLLTKKRAPRSK